MEEKNCFDKKVSALKTQKKALFVKIKFNLLNLVIWVLSEIQTCVCMF